MSSSIKYSGTGAASDLPPIASTDPYNFHKCRDLTADRGVGRRASDRGRVGERRAKSRRRGHARVSRS